MPVSSYTTSTPVGEYTRSTVWPVHLAPAYSALHRLTVNVWPALAVTPQVASYRVSVFVLRESTNMPHRPIEVGANVGVAVGVADGAVG